MSSPSSRFSSRPFISPTQRKLVLTVHVVTSVGLLGAIAAFLALAILGVAAPDEQAQRGVYPAMALVARAVILLAAAALAIGLVQALGTPWGLFRHYWVLLKVLLTVFATAILLIKMPMIGHAARLASDITVSRADLSSLGVQLLACRRRPDGAVRPGRAVRLQAAWPHALRLPSPAGASRRF